MAAAVAGKPENCGTPSTAPRLLDAMAYRMSVGDVVVSIRNLPTRLAELSIVRAAARRCRTRSLLQTNDPDLRFVKKHRRPRTHHRLNKSHQQRVAPTVLRTLSGP